MTSTRKKPTRRSTQRTRRTPSARGMVRGAALVASFAFAVLYLLLVVNPLGWDMPGADSPDAQVSTLAAASTRTPFTPQTDTPAPTATLAALPPQTAPTATLTTTAPEPPVTGEAAGDWWQVLFTDPTGGGGTTTLDGPILPELLQRIAAAQQSIHLAVYEFNLTPIADALLAAQRRGVDVRWITDDEYGLEADQEPDRGQFALLQAAGIPVIADNRGALMHNKFILFDRQVVWTGSTNLTQNDLTRNNNNVILIRSAQLTEIYETQFEQMWQGQFGPNAPSNVAAQSLVVEGVNIQALFSPEDDALAYIVPLIQQAQRSIRFMAFSYTHDALAEAMLARARAGVEVRGVFETRGSQTPYSALRPLFCAGLPVRQDGNPRTLHHKVILVDDQILVTGSLNLSDNANNPNNENTLVINSAALVAPYLQEFERRWAEAKQPDAAVMACP